MIKKTSTKMLLYHSIHKLKPSNWLLGSCTKKKVESWGAPPLKFHNQTVSKSLSSSLNAVFPNYCFSNLELNVRNVDHLALSLFYSSQFHPSEESTLQMSNLKENPWNQLTRHQNYWICKVFMSLHYHQLNQLDSSGLLLCPFLHVIIFFIFMINFHHPYFVFA